MSFEEVSKLMAMPNVELRINCTFCPEQASGDLTVEAEPGMFIPLPICESCLAIQAKNFNMIERPQ
jgi:hypothetical protein